MVVAASGFAFAFNQGGENSTSNKIPKLSTKRKAALINY